MSLDKKNIKKKEEEEEEAKWRVHCKIVGCMYCKHQSLKIINKSQPS